MAFRFGLSPALHCLSPLIPLVSKETRQSFDMTLFLQFEDEQWVRSKVRQLRPVFVVDVNAAIKVMHELEQELGVNRTGPWPEQPKPL